MPAIRSSMGRRPAPEPRAHVCTVAAGAVNGARAFVWGDRPAPAPAVEDPASSTARGSAVDDARVAARRIELGELEIDDRDLPEWEGWPR